MIFQRGLKVVTAKAAEIAGLPRRALPARRMQQVRAVQMPLRFWYCSCSHSPTSYRSSEFRTLSFRIVVYFSFLIFLSELF